MKKCTNHGNSEFIKAKIWSFFAHNILWEECFPKQPRDADEHFYLPLEVNDFVFFLFCWINYVTSSCSWKRLHSSTGYLGRKGKILGFLFMHWKKQNLQISVNWKQQSELFCCFHWKCSCESAAVLLFGEYIVMKNGDSSEVISIYKFKWVKCSLKLLLALWKETWLSRWKAPFSAIEYVVDKNQESRLILNTAPNNSVLK